MKSSLTSPVSAITISMAACFLAFASEAIAQSPQTQQKIAEVNKLQLLISRLWLATPGRNNK
jgi:hypothetical protein